MKEAFQLIHDFIQNQKSYCVDPHVQFALENERRCYQQKIEMIEKYGDPCSLHCPDDYFHYFSVAEIIHDVGNTLNSLVGFFSVFEETGLRLDQKKLLLFLKENVRCLMKMLDGILEAFRSQTLDIKERFDPTATIRDVCEVKKLDAKRKGLQLLFEPALNFGRPIRGNALALRRMVLNLLDNAIEYTAEGKVEVRMSFETRHFSKDLCLKVVVADTGKGMPANEMNQSFYYFPKTDFPKPDNGRVGIRHFGLGLGICKRICDVLGGSIRLSNNKPRGLKVECLLPIYEDL